MVTNLTFLALLPVLSVALSAAHQNEAGAEITASPFNVADEIGLLNHRVDGLEQVATDYLALQNKVKNQTLVIDKLQKDLAGSSRDVITLSQELKEINARLQNVEQRSRNIKEVVWKKPSGTDSGLIFKTQFRKLDAGSRLKLTFNGATRIKYIGEAWDNKCNRWYFTINGQECRDPAPIDGVLYVTHKQIMHRPTTIEGMCNKVPLGVASIELKVGKCPVTGELGDAMTCGQGHCRITVEEI